MKIQVQGHETYAYTAGRAFDAARPSVIFIHGVLCDHSVWALQSRHLAHRGFNVFALDLPGHCKSAGDAPQSVEAAADFVVQFMDAAGLEQAALVGHSWGSLIALHAASRLLARASHLALVGTAYPMPVSPALLQAAQDAPQQAITMINTFSRATLAPPLGAGSWVYGAGVALARHVLRSNPRTNLLHTGFVACNNYQGGEEAMRRVTCPVLFVLGQSDQMTPPKAARTLMEAARADSRPAPRVVQLPCGHNQMSEAPEETLQALRGLLGACG